MSALSPTWWARRSIFHCKSQNRHLTTSDNCDATNEWVIAGKNDSLDTKQVFWFYMAFLYLLEKEVFRGQHSPQPVTIRPPGLKSQAVQPAQTAKLEP